MILDKEKYYFNNMYYADLDTPNDEIKRFYSNYLKNKKNNILFISIQKSNKIICNIECKKYSEDIKKYLFIESKLAGVGIENFIVEVENNNNINEVCKNLKSFFTGMNQKEYYSDKWIETIFKRGITTLYKTDSDGDVLFKYKILTNKDL